ncbi:MAG: hypothetical protein IT291_09780 [Deltaproteobacteria bacterium]|nr:hypothetical protein [Deltaproteobacteria bacterium]
MKRQKRVLAKSLRKRKLKKKPFVPLFEQVQETVNNTNTLLEADIGNTLQKACENAGEKIADAVENVVAKVVEGVLGRADAEAVGNSSNVLESARLGNFNKKYRRKKISKSQKRKSKSGV